MILIDLSDGFFLHVFIEITSTFNQYVLIFQGTPVYGLPSKTTIETRILRYSVLCCVIRCILNFTLKIFFFSNFVKRKIIKKKTHSKKLAPILIQKSETKWMV